MACEGPSLTKSDPRGQESLADPDDWPAADPGPGLSLRCPSAVSLQRALMPVTTENNSLVCMPTYKIKSNNLGLNPTQFTGIFCNNFVYIE